MFAFISIMKFNADSQSQFSAFPPFFNVVTYMLSTLTIFYLKISLVKILYFIYYLYYNINIILY